MNDHANTPQAMDAQSAREANVISAGNLFRGIVLRHIMTERDDPSEMKARVMIAREHGHLDDEGAEDMIVLWGLENA